MGNTTHNKDRSTTSKLVFTAVFAALICVSTFMIRIPVPATQGYIHFGDIFVMLAGIFCGPGYGFLAAGIGSGLADLFSGYAMYAPVTFAIKALGCLAATYIFKTLTGNNTLNCEKNAYTGSIKRKKSPIAALIVSGLAFTAVIIGGYYLFEAILYGQAALLEIPMNALQGAFATAGACGLYKIFFRVINLQGKR